LPFKLAICELHISDSHRYIGIDEIMLSSHHFVNSIIYIYEYYTTDYNDYNAILKEYYIMWLYQLVKSEHSITVVKIITHLVIINDINIIDDINYIKLYSVKV
jgi:hypothetical protein